MLTPRWFVCCILIVVLPLSVACSSRASDSVLASEKSEVLPSPEVHIQESAAVPLVSNPITTQQSTAHESAVPLSEILSAHTTLLRTVTAMRDKCITLVFTASIQRGGELTLVGTMTFDAGGNVAYAPTPIDRLHIRDADGTEADLRISQFEGSNFEDAQSFRAHDHTISCVWRSEIFDVQIASVRVGAQNQQTINGWVFYDNQRVEADLTQQTHEQFNVDGESHQVDTIANGSTTVEGLLITVNEETEYRLINTSQQVKQRFNLTWAQSADRYQLQDGYVQYTLREGRPVELDFWQAQGTLLKNAALYGEISLQNKLGALQVVLNVPQAEIVLSEWQ